MITHGVTVSYHRRIDDSITIINECQACWYWLGMT